MASFASALRAEAGRGSGSRGLGSDECEDKNQRRERSVENYFFSFLLPLLAGASLAGAREKERKKERKRKKKLVKR